MNQDFKELLDRYDSFRRRFVKILLPDETILGEWFFKSGMIREMTRKQYDAYTSRRRQDKLDDGDVVDVIDEPVEAIYVMLTSVGVIGWFIYPQSIQNHLLYAMYDTIRSFHYNPNRKSYRLDFYYADTRHVVLYDLVPFPGEEQKYDAFLPMIKERVEDVLFEDERQARNPEGLD